MIALAGVALLQVMGAVLRALVTRERLRTVLRAPSSFFFAVALLSATSLGFAGLVLASAFLVVARLASRPMPEREASGDPPRWALLLAVLVLAKEPGPLFWDEFVWLGKARLESLGFGAGVQAALTPGANLIPPGYPPLWPSLVGWVSLGQDRLTTHAFAASLVVLVCLAVAAECWAEVLDRAVRPLVGVAVLASAPFLWVHARSVYVDLPVGLLGLALLGALINDRLPVACALAVTMAGLKDEGLALTLAATLGALSLTGLRQRTLASLLPALLAVIAVVTWRLLLARHGVAVVDHALEAPAVGWAPTLASLLTLHAADVPTWGVFWAVALAVLVLPQRLPVSRSLQRFSFIALAFVVVALVFGTERVRVFAENGTLLNRLLVQLWPGAALLVALRLSATESPESAPDSGGAEPGPPDSGGAEPGPPRA